MLMLYIFVNNYICMTKFIGIKKLQNKNISNSAKREQRRKVENVWCGFF